MISRKTRRQNADERRLDQLYDLGTLTDPRQVREVAQFEAWLAQFPDERTGQLESIYQTLDGDARDFVQQRTGQIKAIARRAAQDMIDIGHALIDVKECLGHGRFGHWLKWEFEWTERTAENFMNVARRFADKSEIISDFSPTVLGLLAAPSTPESAIEEAVSVVQSGGSVKVNDAKEIIRKHRPSRQRPSKPKQQHQPTSQAGARGPEPAIDHVLRVEQPSVLIDTEVTQFQLLGDRIVLQMDSALVSALAAAWDAKKTIHVVIYEAEQEAITE